MNDLILSDEDIHGICDEQFEMIEKMQDEIDELEAEKEDWLCDKNFIRKNIADDLAVIERCLKENIAKSARQVYILWQEYDKKLLKILSDN